MEEEVLSFGGRFTLIKSVLSTIPVYYISLFKMPEGVSRILDKIQSYFLWGDNGLEKKLHLVSWNKVTSNLNQGGLGVRRIRDMNDCLLIKWW